MSPLDSPKDISELPLLRANVKLGDRTPRPPLARGTDSPSASPGVENAAYPKEHVAPPTFFAPRPPEGPKEPGGRRRTGGSSGAVTPRETRKGASTSLPPVPLTAREKYRDDFGASGTSNGSGRSVHSAAPLGATAPAAPPGPNARVRSGSRHLKAAPKAPSPVERASPVERTSPVERESPVASRASPEPGESQRESPEHVSPPSTPGSGYDQQELRGQEQQLPSSSFQELMAEMQSEKELWNEKTLALLTSNPTLGAYASTALPSTPTISASVEPEAEEVEEDLELPQEPPLQEPEEDMGEGLIAQALRQAGLDPEQTSVMDLVDLPVLEEELACEESRQSLEGWRESSKSWAQQRARRKKERCLSERATPCDE